jgi:preprotein translocase subunit YajC
VEWLGQLFFFVAIAAIFWLLLIRPNVRRQKQQVAMQEALRIGDQVMLTSGFFGTLTALHDDRVEVELAPGTTVTVARGAVGSVVPPADLSDGASDTEITRPTEES